MKQLWVCAIGLAMIVVAGCEGGGGDATCAVCETSFSEAQCASFAMSQGCSGSSTYVDERCPDRPNGCAFTGCPDAPIMCRVSSPDAGL